MGASTTKVRVWDVLEYLRALPEQFAVWQNTLTLLTLLTITCTSTARELTYLSPGYLEKCSSTSFLKLWAKESRHYTPFEILLSPQQTHPYIEAFSSQKGCSHTTNTVPNPTLLNMDSYVGTGRKRDKTKFSFSAGVANIVFSSSPVTYGEGGKSGSFPVCLANKFTKNWSCGKRRCFHFWNFSFPEVEKLSLWDQGQLLTSEDHGSSGFSQTTEGSILILTLEVVDGGFRNGTPW